MGVGTYSGGGYGYHGGDLEVELVRLCSVIRCLLAPLLAKLSWQD